LGPKFTVFSLFSKKVLCQPQFLTYDLEFWICCGAGREKILKKNFLKIGKIFLFGPSTFVFFTFCQKSTWCPHFSAKTSPFLESSHLDEQHSAVFGVVVY
jgi:hypothetical protein